MVCPNRIVADLDKGHDVLERCNFRQCSGGVGVGSRGDFGKVAVTRRNLKKAAVLEVGLE